MSYKKINGVLVPEGYRGRVKASFDSAQSGSQMASRFAYANNRAPDIDNNTQTRATIRNRARYEAQNSTYARGITLTIANDTIGTGPRLQVLTNNKGLNQQIERDFQRWSQAVGLPEKLRLARMAKAIDGEVLIELVTNMNINNPVKLDLALYEADYLVSPTKEINSDKHYDGIDFDTYGNPTRYWLLDSHEAVGGFSSIMAKPKPHDASNVIHYFRPDRPGQRRGVSEIQSALELFNMLRCYTKSVLDAAETAANHAVLLYTQGLPDQEPDDVAPWYEESMTRNMMKALPYGWDARQLKPEQPTNTYKEFKNEIINEIARCLNVPFNVAALNSSDYNYASGRLDHQTYFRALEVETKFIESLILSKIYQLWIMEYGYVRGLNYASDFNYRWYWDGHPHVDPQKEANAQKTRLENMTTTLAEEYAAQGMDWETALEQLAAEKQKMKELGLIQGDSNGSENDSSERG